MHSGQSSHVLFHLIPMPSCLNMPPPPHRKRRQGPWQAVRRPGTRPVPDYPSPTWTVGGPRATHAQQPAGSPAVLWSGRKCSLSAYSSIGRGSFTVTSHWWGYIAPPEPLWGGGGDKRAQKGERGHEMNIHNFAKYHFRWKKNLLHRKTLLYV
jgi:hypothetical protein